MLPRIRDAVVGWACKSSDWVCVRSGGLGRTVISVAERKIYMCHRGLRLEETNVKIVKIPTKQRQVIGECVVDEIVNLDTCDYA